MHITTRIDSTDSDTLHYTMEYMAEVLAHIADLTILSIEALLTLREMVLAS